MEDDQQPIDYLAGWRMTEPFVIADILSHGGNIFYFIHSHVDVYWAALTAARTKMYGLSIWFVQVAQNYSLCVLINCLFLY
jgi:hypothetical protein